jgi:GNAT superfamily N-acetyltransferase
LLTVTYLLETPNDTLAIDYNSSQKFKSLLRKKIKGELLYKLLNRNSFPSVKISRFAIHECDQNKGIGTELLQAIVYNFIENNKTGCAFIALDALNKPKVIKFYENSDFNLLTQKDLNKDSRLMYRCLISSLGK